MKKLTFLFVVLFAQMAQASTYYTGFAVSGAVGGILLDSDVQRDLTGNGMGFITLDYPSTIHLEGRGVYGWLGVSYSHQFNNHFVLGAEATASLTNADLYHNNEILIAGNQVSTIIENELQNDFALVFKPGYVLMNDTQIYGLLGARWGNFESTLTTVSLTTTQSDQKSAYQLGFTVGLGIEHMITKALSLGLEYAYTDYGNIAELDTSAVIISGLPIDIVNHGEVDMRTNTIGATLRYHF